MESRNSKLIADGRAWRVDGRAQALVGPGLATPLRIPIKNESKPIIELKHFICYAPLHCILVAA